MAGERQFFLHGEDSHPHAALALDSASRGRMKVVSERFISLAIACISASLSPRASKNTAREFPSRGLGGKHIPLRHGQPPRLAHERSPRKSRNSVPREGMRATPATMQKDCGRLTARRAGQFDTGSRRFYPRNMFLPLHRLCHVLLSPGAGVWVGISEILSSPPGEAGGFRFHPLLPSLEAGLGRLSES